MSDSTYACFRCGDTGHVKSECPNRTPAGSTPPGARQEAAPENREIKTSDHCLTCGSKGAHHPGCGTAASGPERIRAILDAAGLDHSDVTRTEFRTSARMMPRTEAQLRELAARQVAESRAVPRPFDGEECTEESGAA
jgi:Zinc knuckle